MPCDETGGDPGDRQICSLVGSIAAASRLATVLILSLLSLVVACKGGGSGTPSPVASPGPNPFILSEKQKVEAIQMIAHDGRVAKLINNDRYGIGDFLPWTTPPGPDTGRARLIGVIVKVIFEKPYDLEYDWPFAIDRTYYGYWASQTKLPSYDEQVVPYAAKGVTGAVLRVDFDTSKVVGIQPQPFDTIVQPPLALRELTAEEQAKARTIFEGDARVQPLLSASEYNVRTVRHWFLKDRSLGAGLIIDLKEPQTIESDWPYLDVTDSGDSYEPFTVHFKAPDVARLDVLVDFGRGGVVAIIPTHSE